MSIDPQVLHEYKRHESTMRSSIKLSGRAQTSQGRTAQIIASRGVFKWLPVACSNDLVHGSWWYVWGSFLSALIAVVPLVDLSVTIFNVPVETSLKAFDESATWVLLIISGIFFTVGSYVFVRAFESPPKPPLFTWKHFSTDELLAAWLYLFAMSPYIPYAMFYINVNRHRYVYWGAFFASCFFVLASAFFVYTCYPSHHHLLENAKPIILPVVIRIFGRESFLCRHVLTDWLAATWFFLYATLLGFVGSWLLLFSAENDRQIFVWISSAVDSFLFLVGSVYYVSGSYPPSGDDEHIDHDTASVQSTGDYDKGYAMKTTTGEEWDEDTNYRQGEVVKEKDKERPSRGHVELSNLSSTPSALTGLRQNTSSDTSGGVDNRNTDKIKQSGDTSSDTFRPWGRNEWCGTVAEVSASGASRTDDTQIGKTQNLQQSGDSSSSTFRPWGAGSAVTQVTASHASGTDGMRTVRTQNMQHSRDTGQDTFNILHANR